MKISQAIATRILFLCNEHNLSINKLALLSGLTQSTLHSIVCGKSHNPKLLTIIRICDALKIDLYEFFKDPIFNDLDIEL